jgi:molybdate transport system substrate-binding protein
VKRILAAAACALLTACASSGGASGGASGGRMSITVYAAASLTEAFDTIKTQFVKAHPGVSIDMQFGASSDLATQITQGAPADVFASASKKNMRAVVAAGEATRATDFARNTLEIAVPPNNPAHIGSLADLARPGVKVAVCAPAVPCGAVAQQVFANAKLDVKPVADLADVKTTLAAVESGEVDAGLVYVTDVRSAAAKVKGIVIPAAIDASTTYPIAVLKGAPPIAQQFVAYVLSPAGQAVLAADGFVRP